jgi:hypothetical protein
MADTSETRSRKRKQRAVLSCNNCRRRKLKCDRELPCNRCIDGGVAEQCAYGKDARNTERDNAHVLSTKRARRSSPLRAQTDPTSRTQPCESITEEEHHNTNISISQSGKDRVTELELRLATLESVLSSLQNKSEDGEKHTDTSRNAHVDRRLGNSFGLFKGRGYRTFFYGPTNPMVVITHVCLTSPFGIL